MLVLRSLLCQQQGTLLSSLVSKSIQFDIHETNAASVNICDVPSFWIDSVPLINLSVQIVACFADAQNLRWC